MVGDDIPKAFVLCGRQGRNHGFTSSQLSTATPEGRAEAINLPWIRYGGRKENAAPNMEMRTAGRPMGSPYMTRAQFGLPFKPNGFTGRRGAGTQRGKRLNGQKLRERCTRDSGAAIGRPRPK